MDKKAKWIWRAGTPEKNEFVYFTDEFEYAGGSVKLYISAETDYIAYVNGVEVMFGQYAGFPDLKFYDESDITEYCSEGKNTLSVTVRYEGLNSATHIDDGAGVIYSVNSEDGVLACSDEHTRSGLDPRYISGGEPRFITTQLGYAADMTASAAEIKTSCSVSVSKTLNIKPRPIKKSVTGERLAAREIRRGLYDLGREEAGYAYIKYSSTADTTVKLAYGEHIADGSVRYLIGNRNFSLNFHVGRGEGELCQKFVRIAGRYIEIFAPETVTVEEVGIIPVLYPLTERSHKLCGLDKRIYETSVRTLRLCMNYHYEDCPWREQALYALDSRNQMLAGYYAFEETEFQRANLVLISHGVRSDGFLELTCPSVNTPAIPFFSLIYPRAVLEYIRNTGDSGILDEVLGTVEAIMHAAIARIDGSGLIRELEAPYWNFYEWTDGSNGEKRDGGYHLILNCALAYAMEAFSELCAIYGKDIKTDTASLKEAIVRHFYHAKTGLFHLSDGECEKYSEMGQAFALLIGLGDGRTVDALKSGKLIPATLSTAAFVYDALLAADAANSDFVLNDIRTKYKKMLDAGATSFWETIDGESAFCGAGSLCHGWSAIPAYYLKILTEK